MNRFAFGEVVPLATVLMVAADERDILDKACELGSAVDASQKRGNRRCCVWGMPDPSEARVEDFLGYESESSVGEAESGQGASIVNQRFKVIEYGS